MRLLLHDPTGQSPPREVTVEELAAMTAQPQTTLGGVARAGALGAARGAFALPEVAGAVMEQAGAFGGPVGPVLGRVGPVIRKGAQLATRGAERLLGGPTVGDTGLERFAGVAGEVAGAVGTGGVALAPVRGAGMAMAARGVRAIPSMTGATGGIHVTREAELGPVGEVAGALTGAGLAHGGAKLATLTGRGTRAAGRALLRDPGEQALDPVTRSLIQRGDDITEEGLRLGSQYRILEDAAEATGATVSTASLKQGVKSLRAKLVSVEQRGTAGRIMSDIDELPDQVSLRELRGYQRAINERLARQKRKGAQFYSLRQLNKIVGRSLEEAADDPTMAGELASSLRMTNAAWRRNQRSEEMLTLWRKGADRLLSGSGRTRRLNPISFQKWLRDNGKTIREHYGDEHYQNLLRIGRNIDRIPDDLAVRIAGPLDAERAATLEVLKTGARIATAPIGSLRWRGRRAAESMSRAFSWLADEQRGVAVVQAMDDPSLARELVAHIAGRPATDFGRLTYPARLALPGVAGER